MQPETDARLVLVTGPSGAGRTTAIHALEDIGFEAIDNLPLTLIPRLLSGSAMPRPLALGVDVRNRDFSTQAMMSLLDKLERDPDVSLSVVYLDARDDVLIRRFSETRRRHPLTPGAVPQQGIAREQEMLQSIRARAEFLIDTSDLSPHDLRAELQRAFAPDGKSQLSVSIQSFSYKRGLPRGLDIVLDCRFLRNPHWEATLRDLDGRNAAVADFVRQDSRFEGFFDKVQDMVDFLLPAFVEEGKAYLGVGFGCTGGRHRSVTVAELLAKTLANKDWQVSIRHRELERQTGDMPPERQGRQR